MRRFLDIGQWRTGRNSISFARSIGLATAGLVVLTIALAGFFSYGEMRNELTRQAEESLRRYASLVAKLVGADLGGTTATMSVLGQNTTLTNALTDSVGRETYLEPLLEDFRLVDGRHVETALFDAGGVRVSGSPDLELRDSPFVTDVLGRGRQRAWLGRDEHGVTLTVAQPILGEGVSAPEGAFLYRVDLSAFVDASASLFEREERFVQLPPTIRLIAVSRAEGGRSATFVDRFGAGGGKPVADEVVERRPVDVGDFAGDISVDIEVGVPRASVNPSLPHLVAVHVLSAAVGIVLALGISDVVGRMIARPLRHLESVATRIVASGFLGHRFAETGPREVARLAAAFNAMLRRLQETHDQLAFLARVDSLTGLANRANFHERLREALATAGRTGMTTALFLLDLDDFKQINDRLGHPAGDALLRGVAHRLVGTVRRTDVVARLGGDEFAVVATNQRGPETVEDLARKIARCFDARFDLDGQYVVGNASIGVAVCRGGGCTPDELFGEADLALYQSKADKGGGVCFFHPGLTDREDSRRRNEGLIRELLASDAFLLGFQPKVELHSGAVAGCEALLRCPPPHEGIEIGRDLIPAAEASGLVNALGEWVILRVCEQAREWRALGLPLLPIAVNVSVVQLRRPELVDFVRAALDRFSLPAASLEFEITESAVMERAEVIGETVSRLREAGLRLSIDDFGTGYSSLTHLKRLPVHALKIDRSFVDGVAAFADDAAIARAVIALGLSLGLDVIAEGVETMEQEAFLRAHGCQFGQGFLYGPPMSAEDLRRWWQARSATQGSSRRLAGA